MKAACSHVVNPRASSTLWNEAAGAESVSGGVACVNTMTQTLAEAGSFDQRIRATSRRCDMQGEEVLLFELLGSLRTLGHRPTRMESHCGLFSGA
jgi:hypothetical protein